MPSQDISLLARPMTGVWAGDPDRDLRVIKGWGAYMLLAPLEPQEFEELGILDLLQQAKRSGLVWQELPTAYEAAPDNRFLQPSSTLERPLAETLTDIAGENGLDRAKVVAFLVSNEGLQKVRCHRCADRWLIDCWLNAQNLFDKVYVAECGNANYCGYGLRRSAMLKATYAW